MKIDAIPLYLWTIFVILEMIGCLFSFFLFIALIQRKDIRLYQKVSLGVGTLILLVCAILSNAEVATLLRPQAMQIGHNSLAYLLTIVLIGLIISFVQSGLFFSYLHQCHDHLSPLSIQEAFDKMNNGIVFYDKNQTLLQNRQMQHLQISLLGQRFLSGDYFYESLETSKLDKEVYPDFIIIHKDGLSYLFTRREVVINQNHYREILAYQIDKEMSLIQKLRDQTASLKETEQSLAQMVELKEKLQSERVNNHIKNIIHNQLSYKISYLSRQIEKSEYGKVDIPTNLANIFNEDSREESALSSRVNIMIDDLKTVGVTLSVQGCYPRSVAQTDLYYQFILEGVSNAIRHAHADHLLLQFSENENNFIISLSNNGIIPPVDKNIIYGTGLTTLDKLAKEYGGELSLTSGDSFIVSLKMDKHHD